MPVIATIGEELTAENDHHKNYPLGETIRTLSLEHHKKQDVLRVFTKDPGQKYDLIEEANSHLSKSAFPDLKAEIHTSQHDSCVEIALPDDAASKAKALNSAIEALSHEHGLPHLHKPVAKQFLGAALQAHLGEAHAPRSR